MKYEIVLASVIALTCAFMVACDSKQKSSASVVSKAKGLREVLARFDNVRDPLKDPKGWSALVAVARDEKQRCESGLGEAGRDHLYYRALCLALDALGTIDFVAANQKEIGASGSQMRVEFSRGDAESLLGAADAYEKAPSDLTLNLLNVIVESSAEKIARDRAEAEHTVKLFR